MILAYKILTVRGGEKEGNVARPSALFSSIVSQVILWYQFNCQILSLHSILLAYIIQLVLRLVYSLVCVLVVRIT